MKYEGIRPSGVDIDISVYKFVMGEMEIRLLIALVDKARKDTPFYIENVPMRGRLSNLKKGFELALLDKYEIIHGIS